MQTGAAPRLFLNGKFYGSGTSGVHRVADRLIRELDRLAVAGAEPAGWDMRLLRPAGHHWTPPLRAIRTVPQPFGHTQFWEQAVLPFAARGGTLASFANLAPRNHPRMATMVHDVQFRLSPASYPAKLRWGYRLLVPRGAKASRLVLTVSDYARDSLDTFGVAPASAVQVLPNGGDHILEAPADRTVLARHGLERGRYGLLFGSVAGYKNLGVVLAAFARPELARLPLVVVGPARERLAAAGLLAPPTARFVGEVDDGELRALYEGATCLLYPSRTEGFGLPPLEAMWCGCPVLAAPAGAMPEVCRDAVCYAGLDDAGEWAERAAALARDPSLRAAKIAAGHARAQPFTWARSGLRLVEALRPLMEEQAGLPSR